MAVRATFYLKKIIRAIINFVTYSPGTTIGSVILAFILFLGFVVSFFAPYDPRRWGVVPRDLSPSPRYIFGTTTLGQDVFWLLTWSIRNSLLLGSVASAVGLAIGAFLGLIAGYKGGIVEKVMLFFSDTLVVLPSFPLLILISSLIREQLNVITLGLVIAFLTWGMPVRNVRSLVLSLREMDFTYTAKYTGYNTLKLVFSEYIPHVLPWMIASFMSRINMAIGLEVTLAVLGLSSLQEATLGTILYWSLKYQALMRGIWWWVAAPVITCVLLVLSLYLTAVGVAQYINPRTRLQGR